MKNKYFILTFVMACLWQAVLPSAAAGQDDRKMLSAGTPFFVPHWYVKAQGGAAYDVGEASFSQLLSPAVQLSIGYQPHELFGVRGGLSGF